MGLADLHLHTLHSFDGTASPRQVLEAAARRGLDLIAVTDHDTLRGALEARSLAAEFGLQVIPGAEISTRAGHLLALFIEADIPAGLTLTGTLRRVGDQGGLAIAAHPAQPIPNCLSLRSIQAALEDPRAGAVLLGVEVCNLNPTHSPFNAFSIRAAARLPLAPVASSDAHIAEMVGAAVTRFEGTSPADLRRALAERATSPEQVEHAPPIRLFLRWLRAYLRRKRSAAAPAAPLRRNPADR